MSQPTPPAPWYARLRRPKGRHPGAEPPFDPASWSGALIVMCSLAAVLWVIEVVNAADHQGLDRFGLRPRRVDGLWGIMTQPFLHAGYPHLVSNTAPFVLIGWVVLLSGLRSWLAVTGVAIVVGGLATWVVAPAGVIVGASGLVFAWLGYLLARAYFSRKLWWIVVAVLVLFFFGTLLNGLLPEINSHVSWQSHVCGFGGGVVAAAVLHPRRPRGKRPPPLTSGVS
jgi:membrane associated rhomboid family serine protease